MPRITARRVIAFVQYKKAVALQGDLTGVRKKIRNPVGIDSLNARD